MNVHRLSLFDDSAATRLQEAVRGYPRAVIFVTLFLSISNYTVLNVRDYLSDDRLILDVRDDGLEGNGKTTLGTGIGLAIVRELLVRRFGNCCQFEAGRALPRGFHVHMKLPLSLVS